MTLNILFVLIGSLLILLFYLWWLRSEGQKQQERQSERITFDRIMQASIHSGQRAKNHNLPPRAAGHPHRKVS